MGRVVVINKLRHITGVFKKLLFVLTKKQKQLMLPVIIMMLINAFLQMIGVSVFVPLVSAMTEPDELMEDPVVIKICSIFGLVDSMDFFVFLSIVVILLYIVKNSFSVFQIWVSARYAKNVQRELSSRILHEYMKRDYDFFLQYDTSKVLRDISSDAFEVNNILSALSNIVTEGLTIVLILVYIFVSDVKMSLCIMLIAMICIYIIYHFFREKMDYNGRKFREATANTQKVLLQAVEGIKEVQVLRKQDYFVKKYQKACKQEQKPSVAMTIGISAPTYVVEGFFVSGLMAFICIRSIINPEYISSLPTLASFMMGAIRMLPSLGRISNNINNITYGLPALNSVYDNLTFYKDNDSNIINRQDEKIFNLTEFHHDLKLASVCWHYKDSEDLILNNLSLCIKKGESVGIIGQSGAGKSTLADIILGLHIPQSGEVLIDGINIFSIPESYSRIIGYVPQTVYLIDGTIRENVAFGISEDEIDDQKVIDALRRAQLLEFINEQKQKLDTEIGERGVRLSGGQRQRIAIARALYRNPQILIMDEATSALDNETEKAVMEAIETLYGTITMIIIAHRLTTVRKCDVIYEVKDGNAVKVDKMDLFS